MARIFRWYERLPLPEGVKVAIVVLGVTSGALYKTLGALSCLRAEPSVLFPLSWFLLVPGCRTEVNTAPF